MDIELFHGSTIRKNMNRIDIKQKLDLVLLVGAGIFSLFLLSSCSNDDDADMDPDVDDKEDTTTVNLPPSDFELIEVADLSTNVGLMPVFKWEEAIDPESTKVVYDFFLDTQTPPTNVYAANLTENTFSVTEKLAMTQDYFWKVVAKDSAEASTESAIFRFRTLENQPPGSFNLIGVTDEAIGVDLFPTFTWHEAEDPEGDAIIYSLLLDTLTQPTTVVVDGLQGLSYELSDRLLLKTSYHWKIRASDSEGNETDSEVYSFTTRGLNVPDQAVDTELSARYAHATTILNDKLWLVGGFIEGNGNQNDVWSSVDGVTWDRLLTKSEAPFVIRNGHQLVAFNNKLWLIGGASFGDWPTDIWSSKDGISWQLAQEDVPFGTRAGHITAVFDNKLWLIGGRNQETNRLNDLWVSSDGVSWALVTANAPFDRRSEFSSLVFDNKLWLIGGAGPEGTLNDVWFSADGESWSRAVEHADFPTRSAFDSFVLDGRIWIVGGADLNDIWSSTDGLTWTQNVTNPNFTPRIVHTADVFKDKVFVIGGRDPELNAISGIWVLD